MVRHSNRPEWRSRVGGRAANGYSNGFVLAPLNSHWELAETSD